MKRTSPVLFLPLTMVALLFLLHASGCSGGEKQAETLRHTMNTVRKTWHGCTEGDPQCTFFKCSYPVFTGGRHATAINRTITAYIVDSTYAGTGVKRSLNRTIASMADGFMKDYESYRAESEMDLPFQFELSGQVVLNQQGLLTVDISYASYTGGAHGINHTRYFVFDTATGKRLRAGDIFVRGFEQRLNRLIDAKFREQKGLSAAERLDSEKGGLFNNSISFNDNLAMTTIGIMFLYNSYEIAPYAEGPTEIFLRYRELGDILKPELTATVLKFSTEE
jgi:hypothetical protein